MNVVLFIKDLRLHDHQPLVEALQYGEVLPLYIVEPTFWSKHDLSIRHFQFVLESLEDLKAQIEKRGGKLFIFIGKIEEALEQLSKTYGAFRLFYYEYTSIKEMVNLNTRVCQWMKEHGLPVACFPSQAYFLDIENESQYKKRWRAFMNEKMHETPVKINIPNRCPSAFQTDLSALYNYKVQGEKIRFGLKGGETNGKETLNSYLQYFHERHQYKHLIDEIRYSSRLSPYMTWGNLSLRYVIQQVDEEMKRTDKAKLLQTFVQKIYQRCVTGYFVQGKFYDVNHEDDSQLDVLNKWIKGRTGIPIIDAIMRYVMKTGWINHQSRLVAVSFIRDLAGVSTSLIGQSFAQLLLDYDPLIQYCYIEEGKVMNPIAFSKKHDPNGEFIRRHVSELKNVPSQYIHEPWLYPGFFKLGYPSPIVDVYQAYRKARHERLRKKQIDQHSEQLKFDL
ncbi:FAD-binding domain-containing protein [Aeribacillus alveayuensis]|uniref:Deoxyribodipyrimidine photo-lyase n=1 Tax=Aeribacillus alveayuensis TaxID=279215 RepID=A0ABT9VR93_9BACI|nr:deoxyribodipyrimidine photo-lyase [Bacillus alveayuensis]